ncbi:Rho termination factor N-terminal domain-containing protein [Fuchsiella alkaliacetigena]|uniref:Rho termination factor N-terminal domain-containing protein n=1 Tax=Fuchsiella alkaliacetigena TaxID=957042 RepID=UPI00200B0A79|nr:Rho termination factor N-terminal domain-containing protein [Fuchsiella alkaliacetigena]MCK8824727.1 Rho termination factor N-terminal domain-containing protein [Fuchsiella alkaliacetigena]
MKVKLLRSTFSRTEAGKRVTYKAGEVIEDVSQNTYESFKENMQVIQPGPLDENNADGEDNTGDSKEQDNSSKESDSAENEESEYTREELEAKNVTGEDGLRSIGSELGVTDYNNLKKKELIKEILAAQEEQEEKDDQ